MIATEHQCIVCKCCSVPIYTVCMQDYAPYEHMTIYGVNMTNIKITSLPLSEQAFLSSSIFRYLAAKFGKWKGLVCVARNRVKERLQFHCFVQRPSQVKGNL
ncbi:unnamed protein product [Acanthoscelides obtectus]|uniref:Uncharacterized protein n=1 Tax=Acanthoscelides obtectus TaxID=200917 RepID=A0A9P0NSE3_ACAOB|nr:unnamed protein product [Acanthoscelides obtectus]CAK1649931.1 hypothetical protein AOBTE_LOCUS16498 [Acanthoscelides obtectus]